MRSVLRLLRRLDLGLCARQGGWLSSVLGVQGHTANAINLPFFVLVLVFNGPTLAWNPRLLLAIAGAAVGTALNVAWLRHRSRRGWLIARDFLFEGSIILVAATLVDVFGAQSSADSVLAYRHVFVPITWIAIPAIGFMMLVAGSLFPDYGGTRASRPRWWRRRSRRRCH
jgi:hypothetical protein